MEACHREIRNPRKNPSSFAGFSSPEIQVLCVCLNWGRAEPRLKHRYIVPTAEKPPGFGLPLYSFGLPLWLGSTSHGRCALWQLCFLGPWGGVIRDRTKQQHTEEQGSTSVLLCRDPCARWDQRYTTNVPLVPGRSGGTSCKIHSWCSRGSENAEDASEGGPGWAVEGIKLN